MGKFRRNRPYGLALLRLHEASLSLSRGQSGLDSHRMNTVEERPSDILIIFIWFLILTGAVLIVWTTALGVVLLHAVFFA